MSIIFFRILKSNKNKPNSSKGICTGQIRADQVVKKAIKNLYFICIYLYFSFEMEIIVILPCVLHEQGPHSLRIIIKKVLKLYTMSTKDSVGKIIPGTCIGIKLQKLYNRDRKVKEQTMSIRTTELTSGLVNYPVDFYLLLESLNYMWNSVKVKAKCF